MIHTQQVLVTIVLHVLERLLSSVSIIPVRLLNLSNEVLSRS